MIVVGQQNVLRPGVTIEPQEVKMQDYAAAIGAKVVPPKEQSVERETGDACEGAREELRIR